MSCPIIIRSTSKVKGWPVHFYSSSSAWRPLARYGVRRTPAFLNMNRAATLESVSWYLSL